jgi:hypothetical protein
MTTTQRNHNLRKAREAQRRQRVRRHKAEARQLGDFRAWLALERDAYSALTQARNTYGLVSTEADEAYSAWREALAMNPGLPTDAAFARERGENTED